jgi:DNA invertase Pin-like site-specific DNA recombinase
MNPGTMVLGYARCSTAEQADSGNGLAAQEAAIRAECERRGWTLLEVVRDEGESGKSLDRAGLSSALERIAAGEAAGLVASKLDRLSRSVVDFGTLLEWFTECEATLVALDLGIDTGTPGGRLVANVFASVAEWERETIAARTRDGLAAVRATGRPISRPAVADLPELRERIAAMRAEGRTLQAIADALNAEGVPTPRGGAEWRPSSVQAATGYKRRSPVRNRAELPKLKRRRRSAAKIPA